MAIVHVPILYWSPVTYTNHEKLLSINILILHIFILHAHINYKDMVGGEIPGEYVV